MRIMLALFLMSIPLVALHAYASNATVGATNTDCQIISPEHHWLYRFVDKQYKKGLQDHYEIICKKVSDNDWDLDRGRKAVDGIVSRCGACRDNRINPRFKEHFEKVDVPASLIFAYNQFCEDTYDPGGFAGMKFKSIRERMGWLHKEVFCQLTLEMAHPSGFWARLLEPGWMPALKDYKQRVDSICQELRMGHITFREAVYRWEQANMKMERQFGPDLAKTPIYIFKELLQVFN